MLRFPFYAHQHSHQLPILSLLFICLFSALLAACGGGLSDTLPTVMSPTLEEPTAEVALHSDEAAVPLGLQPIFRYTVTVSGAVNASASGTSVIAENTFAAAAGAGDLIFVVPNEPVIGQYPIGDSASLFASEMFSGSTPESGVLTVSAVDPLVASFALTMSSATGQTVTVNGTMVELVYELNIAFSGAVTLDAAYDASYTPVYLTLTAQDTNRRALIEVYLPSGVTAGTYTLVASGDSPPPDGTLEALLSYDGGPSFENGTGTGTITLTQVGEITSGSLTFSATASDGTSVNVSATFNNVPALTIS